MLPRHMGWKEAAEPIISSTDKALLSKKVPHAFARQMEGVSQLTARASGR